MLAPAHKLVGVGLDDGWTVTERVEPGPGATGGNFSCSYKIVRGDGTVGFLKALDFSRALGAPDPALALQELTEAYNFERDLLAQCRGRGMDRVVRAMGDGKVKVDDSPLGVVQYLIFEGAECDLRVQLNLMGAVETAWKLRSLHHIATGLYQLHGSDIAHQDLKPSNVLVFAGKTSKVADLGCASQKGATGPRDQKKLAGDPGYAPPELLYGYNDPDWALRRLGCDAYLLGSMVVFFFTGLSASALLFQHMAEGHTWNRWSGTYFEVLPYVRVAFGEVLDVFESGVADRVLARELRQIVGYLCEPDPNLRGHPMNRKGLSSPLSLERFVSKFDLLASRAEVAVFGKRGS